MKVPGGFSFAGVNAGIKSNRKDLALVVSDRPAVAAATLTRNLARAAPVEDLATRLPSRDARAVVVNSGNANALTGPQGDRDVRAIREAVAGALGTHDAAVLTASTGVIGMPMPTHKILAAVPALVGSLSDDPLPAAEAIMTTDTRVKMASVAFVADGRDVTLAAICKGSGMIAPSMATMIAVLVTDCAIEPDALQAALRAGVEVSFNALTVDGDMSTNDVVFALANGAAGNAPVRASGVDFDRLVGAMIELCTGLAREIAADGEGATRLLEVKVAGAGSNAIAVDLARAVAGGSLVKAAVFGADPNWGRILAAVGARAGSAGYPVVPSDSRVTVQNVVVYDRAPIEHDTVTLRAKMREPEVLVVVDLRGGEGAATAWGCDLSYDYVKINADYASAIVPRPDGGVTREHHLSNYSPALKSSLLVEALQYIKRFSGTRCVVKYGGAAMVKESLKRTFCEDINLLRSAGLRPVVVHGGGPEITRTLEKLGGKAEFVDGVRVTNASDLKVVEMVLTGAINTELVTLLNGRGEGSGQAIGLSGKDGALLRARKTVSEGGRDLGLVGEVTRVNSELLEMFLSQGYVPIISPVGIGEDGQSYNINADAVAAEVAIAVRAPKLIYLSDVQGVLRNGELVGELDVAGLEAMVTEGTIAGGMKAKARSIARALAGGVGRVHLIDGRVPHAIIAELFTDGGVGTLVVPS